MISRRAALGTAAALTGAGLTGVAAQRLGVLDDGLRAVGVRPHAEPDPRDIELLAEAASDQQSLIADVDAMIRQHAIDDLTQLRSVLAKQHAAVSENTAEPAVTSVSNARDAALTSFVTKIEAAAMARRDGALNAGSLAVTQVLAAMSAGLSQVEHVVRATT